MKKKKTNSALTIWLRTKIYPVAMLLSRTKVKYKIIIKKNYTLKADTPVIFACNHSAFPDIPIALRAIKKHCYTLIGRQNLAFADKIFFFLSGAIWVDRKSKEDSTYAKERIIEYLKKGKSILWFPEATWNLTDNLLMLPMRWGIIDVAIQAEAQIIPIALDYNRAQSIVTVNFGECLTSESFTSKQQGINQLRDEMSTMRWDYISQRGEKREHINLSEQRNIIFQAVTDYPPLNWQYEESCIFREKGNYNTDEVFSHLTNINATIQNSFLFNKRLKGGRT
ncbi:MAG: 1-acyl-sn-glycerol-3-phosphate acyltransferase [Ruminiclostridium sp.]|nr:1-acyl-sn-glycerol-3-phosphate acyltransferase [Ruminiclostridium sp.]